MADGVRAESAAPGLAEAQVQEANAVAMEKTGLAEARVLEAKADATYKQGNADARVLAERLAAEAEGEAKLGQARASAAAWGVPRLGAAMTITLMVGGQLLLSLALDHFGALGVPRQPLNIGRIAGVALVFAGVLLVRRS